MAMRQTLAERMVIDHETGSVTIDGEEFAWHVAEGGPVVERLDPDFPELATVHLPVLVLGEVKEITTFEQDLEWIRAEGARQLDEAVTEFKASCHRESLLLTYRPFENVQQGLAALGRAFAAPLRRRPADRFSLAKGGFVKVPTIGPILIGEGGGCVL